MKRAWSAPAGCTVTAQALALMPICFAMIKLWLSKKDVLATTIPELWLNSGGLFVWEAFVSGPFKGVDHVDDAAIAVQGFLNRKGDYYSEATSQEGFSQSAASLLATGWSIDPAELRIPSIVISPKKAQDISTS